MSSQRWLKAILIFGVIFCLLAAAGNALARSMFPAATGDGRVALITVEGVITADSAPASVFSGAAGASSVAICDELYKALDDETVKAILLRVNSPGGSAAGSDEIYRAIRAVAAKKKVVVSMGDVAASGGYYISSAADYVYANGATLTGSIGVIFELMNWGDAAAKLGIKENALHAGQYKDIGSPWRPMTDDERGKIQTMLTSVHDQFIRAVAAGRKGKLDEAAVRKLATGMIYTGEQAAANGLVDEVGGLHDAEVKARQLGGLPADAPVESLSPASFWNMLLGGEARTFAVPPQALAGLAGAAVGHADDGLSLLARGLYLSTTLRDLQMR